MICSICGDVVDIDEEDFEDSDMHKEDQLLGIPDDACAECKREMRERATEWLDDYSDMHPDETDGEFWEHEA